MNKEEQEEFLRKTSDDSQVLNQTSDKTEQLKIACERGDSIELERVLKEKFCSNIELDLLCKIAIQHKQWECLKVIVLNSYFDTAQSSPLSFIFKTNNFNALKILSKYTKIPFVYIIESIKCIAPKKVKLFLDSPDFENICFYDDDKQISSSTMLMIILESFSKLYCYKNRDTTELFVFLFKKTLKVHITENFDSLFKRSWLSVHVYGRTTHRLVNFLDIFLNLPPATRKEMLDHILEEYYTINNSKYPLLQRGYALAKSFDNLRPFLLILHDRFNENETYNSLNEFMDELSHPVPIVEDNLLGIEAPTIIEKFFQIVNDSITNKNEGLLTFICSACKSLNLELTCQNFMLDRFIDNVVSIELDHTSTEMVKILFNCLINLNYQFGRFGNCVTVLNIRLALIAPFTSITYELVKGKTSGRMRKDISLGNICRVKIRREIYRKVDGNGKAFINAIMSLNLPTAVKNYLRFNYIYSDFY